MAENKSNQRSLVVADIIIIGSSFIGLSTAMIMARQGLKIAILTNEDWSSQNSSKQSGRLFALSYRSCNILSKYGIIDDTSFSQIAQPILHIRAVDQESNAKVDFIPSDIGLRYFGYMIAEEVLRNELLKKVNSMEKITIIDCANISELSQDELAVSLSYRQNSSNTGDINTAKARLLLGCDGKNSVVRTFANIKTTTNDFNQVALAFDISHPSWNHDGIAVEKFYAGGPFAILPKIGGYVSSIIWTEKKSAANFLQNCSASNMEFLVRKRLDGYLGDDIKIITEPKFHKLQCTMATKLQCGRILLLGDSGHAIHPIAGQGLNLGMRDVELLCELVVEHHELGLDIGSSILGRQYAKKRKTDIKCMSFATSLINSIFSHDNLGLQVARRVGLKTFDKLDVVKNLCMMYAAM